MMEADINEPKVPDVEMNVRDIGQEHTQNMICENNSEGGCFPVWASSTPVAEKDENGFVAHNIPSLQSNDSGFSDGTFMSTPASSIKGTPCTSLVSSLSDASSSQAQTSFPDCDISPILRKRVPVRTRKYRHSDPSLHALALQINFMESKDNALKLSQSETTCRDSCEKDMGFTDEIEKVTSTTEKSLRRNLLREAADRSRSSSRSLSSASDELEASFQEMSLEESSSESIASPVSRTSSPPAFSFPSSLMSRSQSPLANVIVIGNEIRDETVISSCDCDKASNSSASDIFLKKPQEVVLGPHLENQHSSIDSEPRKKLAFAASLSLSPKCQTLELCRNISLSSSSINKTVILDERTVCERVSPSAKHRTSWPPHHIISPPLPLPSDVALLLTPSPSQTSSASLVSPTPCCLENSYSSISLSKCSLCENPLLKSPTKRISNGQLSHASVSPHKMRRKVSQGAEKQSLIPKCVKRDLSAGFLSASQDPSHQLERSPQYLNIKFLPNKPSYDDDSQSSNCISSACEWEDDSRKMDEQSKQLQRVIAMFSPSEPSRLIGRRLGLVTCDIIGELHKHNFLLCLETIFKYLPDSDLISVVNVSQTWRSSLEGDFKSFQRYKRLRQAQRRVKLQVGKENALGKLKDHAGPSVTAAKGPLNIVQQQVASTEASLSESEEVELMWDDIRRICPTCYGTALVHPAEDRGICQRGNCSYVFCTLCLLAFHHPKPCKPLFPAASKTDLAGTRKSKKNLRRL